MTEEHGERRSGYAEMHQKLDKVLLLLEDENMGVCKRLKGLEVIVNGNGKPGLAEQMRETKKQIAYGVGAIVMVFEILREIAVHKLTGKW